MTVADPHPIALRPGPLVVRSLVALAAALLLGGATSWGQYLLPDWLVSVANSASGWTLVTVLLLFAARLPTALSAAVGAGSFVLLTVGYAIVSGWRGFPYDPTLFVVVGLVAGPFVGAAAAWLRRRDVRGALATALLTGIAVGEAWYGLTVVGDTTSPVYWSVVGALGILLLGRMLVARLRGVLPRVVAVGGAAAVTALFLLTYGATWLF